METVQKTTPFWAGIIIAYFLIYVVWGSTYFFIGMALKHFPPFLLGGVRFIPAGGILLAVCRIRGEKIFRTDLLKRSAISGVVLLFVDMAVVMLAQQYVSSSFVAIIASSTALWILLLDVPMWKSNFRSFFTIAGAITGFAGVVLLYIEQLQPASPSSHNGRGFLLLASGCISWSLGTLYTKYRSCQEEKVYAFAGPAWQMLFASSLFWLCAIFSGEMAQIRWNTIPFYSWLTLTYLVVFGSLLAYTAYIWLLKVRPATEVATHAYINPFIAILLGVIAGNEQVTFLQTVGLLAILSGVMLINRKHPPD